MNEAPIQGPGWVSNTRSRVGDGSFSAYTIVLRWQQHWDARWFQQVHSVISFSQLLDSMDWYAVKVLEKWHQNRPKFSMESRPFRASPRGHVMTGLYRWDESRPIWDVAHGWRHATCCQIGWFTQRSPGERVVTMDSPPFTSKIWMMFLLIFH